MLNSWGNYPVVKNTQTKINTKLDIDNIIKSTKTPLIAYGNGRSYGDSAMSKNIANMKNYNKIIKFDKKNGILKAQSGIMLNEILNLVVPSGWFLAQTPGTKLITLGGAISGDIHGKNHHKDGCFSNCIINLKIQLANGDIIKCSNKKNQNSNLFKAVCGGMGLLGIILQATIKLKKINSSKINQLNIKTKNLKETFKAFDKYKNYTYSVAWIDCLSKNRGKCLLMLGEFENDNKFNYKNKDNKRLNIPFFFPSFVLNYFSVKIFNFLYYNKQINKKQKTISDIDSFFYPLDSIRNWNRIYGKKGFVQYQFIIPLKNSYKALDEILEKIQQSKEGSFLAVLKLYGKENKNYLSFPIKGYSLALDFKVSPKVLTLLQKLDKIVLKYKGRIYLAKDGVMNKQTFRQGYQAKKLNKFINIKQKLDKNNRFSSNQSKRVGL